MRVKCVLCDKIEKIDDETLMAKRLRNRPVHTYMCDVCTERIGERTKDRWATGQFKVHHRKPKENES
ncbi:uncharacterized protein YlaI [Scopulibacillus darangshiensis]|uniref:Uncharacterized protein YlaI n=1 Tax=Scopulibacillus darangshiensis TaxID=442528 RepID=A0A4R2P8X8_9BACL|nr:YlaI family protein [Scopulibacillus darangshiensis]TCP30511.1 uncharacterized protein YlaI [Scopulibacillus darangshiensis]